MPCSTEERTSTNTQADEPGFFSGNNDLWTKTNRKNGNCSGSDTRKQQTKSRVNGQKHAGNFESRGFCLPLKSVHVLPFEESDAILPSQEFPRAIQCANDL